MPPPPPPPPPPALPPPPADSLTCYVPPSKTPISVPTSPSTTVGDLRDALFSLTDILPSALHITLPSGRILAPSDPEDTLATPLAALPLPPGATISAASAPPPLSVDALAAALAAVRAPQQPPASDAGRVYVRRLRGYYDAVMEYQEARLQARAAAAAPLARLRAAAAEAVTAAEAEEAGEGVCADAALAKELLAWFKGDFFTWVDALDCWSCGGKGRVVGSVEPSPAERKYRASVVEVHECVKCGGNVRFGRFNDPSKLLETQRGRCGEWAQVFTLIAVTAGLEARVCHDNTDHCWTEIWSRKEQRWLHADSCENVLDEPLLYERGWGKKLNYVVAVGVGSVADVTRRYTEKYDEVLTRRTLADEGWLASEIARLNDVAVGAVPAHERAMYIERNERDRARLIGEMPADGSTESLPGRQSGSAAWVRARGEDGEK